MAGYTLDKSKWGGAQAFDALLEEVRQRREEFERQHHVSDDVVRKFQQLGLYRAFVPKSFGGDEQSPLDFLLAIEAISQADGAAGWVASFGMSPIYLGGLPMETLEDIWQSPDDIFAGATFPVHPVKAVDGGYLINGRWKWASGCTSARRVGVGIKPDTENALPSMAVLDVDQVEIDESSWDVQGMAGTGSYDLVVKDVVVPLSHVFVRGGKLTPDGIFFKYPTITLAAQVLAITSAGVARAALDIVIDGATARKSATGAPNIGDRNYVQIEMAKADARLRAARLFFYDSVAAAWEILERGDELDPQSISMMRLSTTYLVRECASVVRTAYHLSGMEAAYYDNHLSRCFRDVHMPTQHAFMGEISYQNAGAIMFGKNPLPGYL